MKKLAFLAIFICWTTLYATSVSVIIPCTQSHLKYLPDLLGALSSQTSLPDEVVVSLSWITDADNPLIEQIKTESYPYDLKVITTTERKFAGENRNIAIRNSKGELLACQDADDLPHRKRIEWIRKLYKKMRFNLLVHYYYIPGNSEDLDSSYQSFNSWELNNIPYTKTKLTPENLSKKTYNFSCRKLAYSHPKDLITERWGAHLGQSVFHRRVFEKLQYSARRTGEDGDLVRDVLHNFNKTFLVDIPLVAYNMSRSTFEERNK